MTADIAFDQRGDWGVATLNRPQALNALTHDMVKALFDQLTQWAGLNAVKAVMVRSDSEKAFCAGGDIRWLYENAKQDPARACQFFWDEYRNNALIYHYPKPYVALIDGIVMGGGVGISVHGDFRIAGDRTLFAMPETGIGIFPDIGGGHFMPRLHDGVGLYYALTGARAKAADCMASGIATHYTPTDKMDALERALLETPLTTHAHADIEAVLDSFADDPGHAPINDQRSDIHHCFEGAETLDDAVARLRASSSDFAKDTIAILARMSPTSLRLTFEQMKRGRSLDFDDVMRMEYRIVSRVMRGHDFFEGVRALLVDKDKNPIWSPDKLDAVSDNQIMSYFETLDDEELKLPV